MVKILSRDAINRMVGRKSSVAGVGGGGGDVDLSGYATKIWTQETFVSIDFFRSLFRAYDSQNHEILPNDTTSTIDNIKAMFGFWTDFYVSALGTGGQSSLGIRLAQLADVNVAGVTNGQVLTYDTTSGKWIASAPQSGTDMATVWANLAAADNTKQIDVSHLTTALTGYATKTWVGLQGYQTQTTADGRYLKLSGGTMTGAITMKANQYIGNYALDMNNSDIVGANSIYTADLSNDWTEGIQFKRTNGNWDSFRAADGDFYMNNNSGNDGACLHVSRLVLSCTNDSQGTANNKPALVIGGTPTTSHIEIDSNEIMAKSNASTTNILYLNAEGGNCIINESSGNCGIGTGSPSYKLHIAGVGYASTGFYTAGYVTALSDARHKNVIGDTGLTVEQIAGAPAIRFTWKDRDDQSVFAGSIAQYWQKVLPEVVQSQADDTLSLDYQVAALISSITVARNVVDHERRIAELERENKELKMKLNIA